MKRTMVLILTVVLCSVMSYGAFAYELYSNEGHPLKYTPKTAEFSGETLSNTYYYELKTDSTFSGWYEYALSESAGKKMTVVSTTKFTGICGATLDSEEFLYFCKTYYAVFDTDAAPYKRKMNIIRPENITQTVLDLRFIQRTVLKDPYTGVVIDNYNFRKFSKYEHKILYY